MEKQESSTAPSSNLLNEQDVPKNLNIRDWLSETENLGIRLKEPENVSNIQPDNPLNSQLDVNRDEEDEDVTLHDATEFSVNATIDNVLKIVNETIRLLQEQREQRDK